MLNAHCILQVEDMLIVNKDRLFLENVGAVRELSKVEASNISVKMIWIVAVALNSPFTR